MRTLSFIQMALAAIAAIYTVSRESYDAEARELLTRASISQKYSAPQSPVNSDGLQDLESLQRILKEVK